MYSLNNFNLKTDKKSANLTEFTIEPLPTGFGMSIGSMLRRTLYSSVKGIGIVSVKINGAYHEYTALKGVTDDILRVLFALKEVVFSGDATEVVVLHLTKKGIGPVFASDFEDNSKIKILNPDHKITEITDDKITFDLEVKLKEGSGYTVADDKMRTEVGVLPLDTDFSPVKNVVFNVSETREGENFGLDKITLLVETDGSVSPEEAMKQACENLNVITSHLVETNHGKVVEINRDYAQYSHIREVDLSIDKLTISTRLYNCLKKMGIEDLSTLTGKTRKEINEIKGLGDKSKKELIKILQKYNIEIID